VAVVDCRDKPSPIALIAAYPRAVSTTSIDLRGLGFGYGPRPVLHNVTATIGAGTRVAVVGSNGVGKSTLLRLVAGLERPESGSVSVRPARATIGFLPQERDRRPDEALGQYLARRTGVAAAEAAMESAAAALAGGGESPASGSMVAGRGRSADDVYAAALDHYLAIGGPDLAGRAAGVLAGLGLDPDQLPQATATLSGGELARAALAAILLSQVDLLLLDEPTNDLDEGGLARLEDFLLGRDGTLLVVSHDRAFLERIADQVLELDEFTHEARLFGGGFSAYVVERERAKAAAREAFEVYDQTRQGLVDRARQEKDWAQQGVGRATSSRARREERDKFIRAANVASAQGRGAAAAKTLRALDRLEAVDDPREPWDLRLALTVSSRSGEDVAGMHDAVVHRGGFTLGPVDLHVARGDRVAIAGANGSGKTTLLAALLGRAELSSGTRWTGASVVIGEIDQVRRTFDVNESLLDAFRTRTRGEVAETRTLLAKFGLGADDVLRPVGSLSPGERTRADLALLMALGANVLVLDEPTNHLDLAAIESLEDALEPFDGTLLLVTHDRRLLERVETNRHLVVERGRVREL
jgi:ATPase subunit of ABC transporter with duplicated ATPase domains